MERKEVQAFSFATWAPQRKGSVDWRRVDSALRDVPAEFTDARFDPLKYVLNTLSAKDADAQLNKLERTQQSVEGLVDDIVASYYSGFNKALHNYSTILALFSEAKGQVDTLRDALGVAGTRLGTHSHALEQTWLRSNTYTDTLRLLDDIQRIVSVPDDIQRAVDSREFGAAADMLLAAANMLQRPEIRAVAALRDAQREVADWATRLLRKLHAQLMQEIFDPQLPPDAPAFAAADGAAEPGTAPHRLSGLASSQHAQSIVAVTQAAIRVSGDDRGAWVHFVMGRASSQDRSFGHQGEAVVRQWMAEGHALPPPPGSAAARQPVLVEPPHPALAAAAEEVMRRLCSLVLKIIENYQLSNVVRDVYRPAVNRSGLQSLLSEAGLRLNEAAEELPPYLQSSESLRGPERLRVDLENLWTLAQRHMVALVTELLANKGGGGEAGGEAGAGAKGGAQASKDGGSSSGALTFSFSEQKSDTDALMGAAAPASAAHKEAAAAPQGGAAASAAVVAGMMEQVLNGWQPGAWLAPVLYPVLQRFSDEALALLSAQPAYAPDCTDWQQALAAPPAHYDASAAPSNLQLRNFLEGYVRMEFLPRVYVEFRGQCSAVLSDPDSLRARTRPRDEEAGRGLAAKPAPAGGAAAAAAPPVLPAATFAEQALQLLLGWAAQMPIFATNLAGVVENILGRVLEALYGRTRAVVGTGVASTLSKDPAVVAHMAREPAAALLEPIMFVPLKQHAHADRAVAQLRQAGLGTGGAEASHAVLRALLAQRPLTPAALVGASSGAGEVPQLMQLAVMARSLDHVAAAMQAGAERCQQQAGNSGRNLDELLAGLHSLRRRYLMLSGSIMRALRLELVACVLVHLQSLGSCSHVCEEDESGDVDDAIQQLCRACMRVNENLPPLMSATHREYVRGGVAAATAQALIWMLPELKGINVHGVARMCHMIGVLQPVLVALGGDAGSARGEAAAALERARGYYQLLQMSADALLRTAAANPRRYSAGEWTALLAADVKGRAVSEQQRQQLAQVVS